MGTARLGPDAVKSSAGALLRKPVCRVTRLTDALTHRARAWAADRGLHRERHTALGYDADLKGPLVLVMGTEDEGISDAVLRMADDLVNIPMAGDRSAR